MWNRHSTELLTAGYVGSTYENFFCCFNRSNFEIGVENFSAEVSTSATGTDRNCQDVVLKRQMPFKLAIFCLKSAMKLLASAYSFIEISRMFQKY